MLVERSTSRLGQSGNEKYRRPSLPEDDLLNEGLSYFIRYATYTSVLGKLKNQKKAIPELGMNADEVAQLADHASNQFNEVTSQGGRLEKYRKTLPPGKDPFRWVVGGDLKKLPKFKDDSHAQLDKKVSKLLSVAPLLVGTPKELIETPGEGEVLTPALLDEAYFCIGLSGENSIASDMENTIEFARNGTYINLRPKPAGDEYYDRGYYLLAVKMEILRTLRYPQSEEVFTRWILEHCSRSQEEFSITMRFLRVFINFTSTQDSILHMQLYKPKVNSPKRGREFFVRAFQTLKDSINNSASVLGMAKADKKLLREFEYLDELIKLRFGEVFNPKYRKSYFTAAEEALTPRSDHLAEFIYTVTQQSNRITSDSAVAAGVVRLWESLGVTDIDPLVRRFNGNPYLQEAIILEAKAAGLIPDPEAPKKLYEKLIANPWYDADELDWDKIIQPDTQIVLVSAITGTFGPETRGHAEAERVHVEHLRSLPRYDDQGRVVQRIPLIIPMLDHVGIPDYPKIPSRVGNIDERGASIFLGLTAAGLSPSEIFFTTRLQPKPTVAKSQEGRAIDTVKALGVKIFLDFRKADREFTLDVVLSNPFFGADTIKWQKPDSLIIDRRANQPGRVRERGGTVIGRKPFLYALLTNLRAMPTETGIDELALVPTIPLSSSTAAITELRETGYSRQIAPGVQPYFQAHWSLETEVARSKQEPQTHYLSGHGIYKKLIDWYEIYFKAA